MWPACLQNAKTNDLIIQQSFILHICHTFTVSFVSLPAVGYFFLAMHSCQKPLCYILRPRYSHNLSIKFLILFSTILCLVSLIQITLTLVLSSFNVDFDIIMWANSLTFSLIRCTTCLFILNCIQFQIVFQIDVFIFWFLIFCYC